MSIAPIISYETWATAIVSSACVGCTSLVPWLFNLTFFERQKDKQQQEGCKDGRMKYLLSFAVGAMLGDIFFHLIPESYQSHLDELDISHQDAHKKVSLPINCGIFMFMIMEMVLEKLSSQVNDDDKTEQGHPSIGSNEDGQSKFNQNNNDLKTNFNQAEYIENNNINNMTNFNLKIRHHPEAHVLNNNNDSCFVDQNLKRRQATSTARQRGSSVDGTTYSNGLADTKGHLNATNTSNLIGYRIDTAGYLSLIANGFDNFMHGLAIGASFLAGLKVGLITTFVIIIHEIPHEICDYAILVNSGFSRLKAVKFQSLVALFGVLGTAMALYVKSMDTLSSCTIWILPFSAGGFLHIALVNLLPEILDRETNKSNNVCQVACVILGASMMAAVALLEF